MPVTQSVAIRRCRSSSANVRASSLVPKIWLYTTIPLNATVSFPTPRDAVAYIMDTFPIVRRKDEEKYSGDYRTKRVILDIYDALQESIRTDKPYQTRLDPPPADPRCCHPRREGT